MTRHNPSSKFVHLHVHSAYSLLEGALTLEKLIKLCKDQGLPAIALTDTNNMFGALEFATMATEAGIQPIIGNQLFFQMPSSYQIENAGALAQYPIVLLAKNQAGYQNLLKLSSLAYTDAGDHSSPQVTFGHLKQYHGGLLLLSGGTLGPIAQLIKAGKTPQAHNLAREFSNLFQGHFYLELMRHGLWEEEAIEAGTLEIAQSLQLPVVATNDVYFGQANDHKSHDALICIAEGSYISVDDRRHLTPQHYFKSAQEMAALFFDIPQAIENTAHIAQRCSFFPQSCKPILPPFATESGISENEELKKQAAIGLDCQLKSHVFPLNPADKMAELRALYETRLNYELDVIIEMGFAGYFLIVSDFIKWAKANNIPVGPGRGSGAGSLTAWCLQITDVDPIRFNLIFERFLNPERVSMPDFDVDFCQERRDEVINYVRQKYGEDRVAQIITYGKLQARAVLRDVGRVLQMPYGQVDRICKLVPNNPANPLSLEEALKAEPKLEEERRGDPMVAELIDISLQLEGLYRHASTHAAGVVIGDRPLDQLVPIYRDPKSPILVTQFNMKFVEKAGLVKFDFLGLKTLTVIEKASTLIRAAHNKNFQISKIPLDDTATFELLRRVETVGIFQLESAGMSDVLRQLQPKQFDEIVALGALYRPGPMDDIPKYLACRHGKEPVTYMHPSLEPILKESFGVMVYQEQVMQIARDLAGYSLGDADLLRRAMGKKIKSEMDKQREIFIAGAAKNQVPQGLAEEIFEKIAKFASYAFPKAHATPYALLSYQTAFLKANYPLEFYAASMTLDAHNTDKINVFRQDMRKLKFHLLPPSINESDVDFSVQDTAVRYALAALKGVGASAMAEVLSERQAKGPYKSIWDFVARLSSKVVNKKQLESLIAAGAFDDLHQNRRSLYEGLDTILAYALSAREAAASPQDSLFGDSELPPHPPLPDVEDWALLTRLDFEYKAVGFYLSAHPLDAYNIALEQLRFQTSASLNDLVKPGSDDQVIPMVAVVLNKKEKISKRGSRFAFVQLSDRAGAFEATAFSDTLAQYGDLLEPGTASFFQMSVRWDQANNQPRLSIQSAQSLKSIITEKIKNVDFTILSTQDLQEVLRKIKPTSDNGVRVSLRVPVVVNDNSAQSIEVLIASDGLYTLNY